MKLCYFVKLRFLLIPFLLLPVSAEAACYAVFNATHPSLGNVVYRTDGTNSGTKFVRDIWNTSTFLHADEPKFMTSLGKRAVFSGAGPTVGRELFVTGGRAGNTRLLKDIFRGSNFSSDPHPYWSHPDSTIRRFWVVKNRAIFQAADFNHGEELWVTDGSRSGTRLLKDFLQGTRDGVYRIIAANDKIALVLAEDTIKGDSLWAVDGTRRGTTYLGPWTSYTSGFISGGFGSRLGKDKIVFAMQSDLWVTNGKPSGTTKIYSFEGANAIRSLAGFSNKGFALFSAYTTKHGRELWRTNGTKKGTMLVRNIMRYNSDSEPSGFHLHRGLIYFSAESDGRGRELWRTNGTKKGTALVDDINRRRLDSNPGQFISMGPRLFFTATKDNQRMAFYLAPSGRARLVDPGGFQVNGGFFKAGARIVWYTYGRGFRSTNTNLNVLAFGLNITAAKKIDSAEICQ